MDAYLHIVWKLQAWMPQSPPKVASVLCKFCRSLERSSGIEDIAAKRDSRGEGPGEKIAFVLPFDLSIYNFRGFTAALRHPRERLESHHPNIDIVKKIDSQFRDL